MSRIIVGLSWLANVAVSLALSKDVIHCHCTTADCFREGTFICHAQSFCYVQLTPMATTAVPLTKGNPRVVRGCVDTRTPLLCKNRRPTEYKGSWPVLLCCREDWCNALVLPTMPSWVEEINGQKTSYDAEDYKDDEYELDLFQASDERPSGHLTTVRSQIGLLPSSSELGHREERFYINPLYIAFPVIGACVMTILVLTSVVILRKRNPTFSQFSFPSEWPTYDHAKCTGDTCRAVLVNANMGATKRMHVYCERTLNTSALKLLTPNNFFYECKCTNAERNSTDITA